MRTTPQSLQCALLVACGAVAVPCGSWYRPHAQDKKPTPPTVQQKIDEFKESLGDRKGGKDAVAIAILDELLPQFEKMKSGEKTRLVNAMAGCLSKRFVQRKPNAAGIYWAVVRGLGVTGGRGNKALRRAYDDKSKFKSRDPWIPLRGEMLEQIGRSEDLSQWKFLVDRARREESDGLRTQAGRALRHYAGAKQAVRKEVCKLLIREFTNIQSNATGTTDPELAQQRIKSSRRLAAVRDAWNDTLQKLSKQKFVTPYDWERFLNKNKNADWDRLASGQSGGKKARRRR